MGWVLKISKNFMTCSNCGQNPWGLMLSALRDVIVRKIYNVLDHRMLNNSCVSGCFVAKDTNRALYIHQSNLIQKFLKAASCFSPQSFDMCQVSQASFSPPHGKCPPPSDTHTPSLLQPRFRQPDHLKCWQSTQGTFYIVILFPIIKLSYL